MAAEMRSAFVRNFVDSFFQGLLASFVEAPGPIAVPPFHREDLLLRAMQSRTDVAPMELESESSAIMTEEILP
jgi:hypothetical protein